MTAGNPSRAAVIELLRKILAKEFALETQRLRPEAHLVDDLDSLDLVALGHEIEESAGVALEQDDVRGLTTLGELADLVGERMDRPKP